MNPSSLVELSVQERLTWLEETATVLRPPGSAGTAPDDGVGVAVGSPNVGVRVGVAVGSPNVGVRVGVAVGGTEVGVRVAVGVDVGVGAKVVATAIFDNDLPAVL